MYFKVILLVFCCIAEISASRECRETGRCPHLPMIDFGRHSCSDEHRINSTCRFTCQNWTDIIGPTEVTCLSNCQWSSNLFPMCQPNFDLCRRRKTRPKCPKITGDMIERAQQYRDHMAEEELNNVKALEAILDGHLNSRNFFIPCYPQFCGVHCVYMSPRKYANRCKFCKRNKVIVCKRQGSFFGR